LSVTLAAIGVAAVGGLGGVSRSLVSNTVGIGTIRPSHQQSTSYLRPRPLLTTLRGISFQGDSVFPTEIAVAAAAAASLTVGTAEATGTASVDTLATLEPTPEPQPAFFIYTVRPGDSVAAIAARFGIEPDSIFSNNPEVRDDPNLLLVGQELVVPSVDGVIYAVRLGDTLSDIAAFYGIGVESIVDFAPNGLSSADNIPEDMVLVLPGAVAPPPAPPPPQPAPAQAAPAPQPASQPTAASASGYVWPFVGPITSGFYEPRGGGIHGAIDIDGFGRCAAPVAASASGTVILAGWDTGGLGNRIVIRHADGSETLYSHLSEIYAGYGQEVAQGETVGAIGSTGYSTGCHLHFGLYIGGVAVDPLGYLP
jgi:murein DD-endopeptidase MepM/ murein hydrolase activator NlpD